MIRALLAFALATLIACLGLVRFASAADAEQPAAPRHVGVLNSTGSWTEEIEQPFRQGLLDEGYVEGRDVVLEWRSANGDYNRLPQLAADLVQEKVDVIVVNSTPAALAAKRATSTIPIVIAGLTDPVGSGVVASLAHPGGNITGPSMMYAEISTKRLQLLKEAIPRLARVAVMWNPDTPPHTKVIQELKAAASSLSLELSFMSARTPEDIGPAFSAVRRAHAQALYVPDDAFFWTHRAMLLLISR